MIRTDATPPTPLPEGVLSPSLILDCGAIEIKGKPVFGEPVGEPDHERHALDALSGRRAKAIGFIWLEESGLSPRHASYMEGASWGVGLSLSCLDIEGKSFDLSGLRAAFIQTDAIG